jgi:multiple sugar transport system permease protein/putative aldouronate transport system permease protein
MGKKKKETYPAPVLAGTVHKPNMKKKILARWQLYLMVFAPVAHIFIFSYWPMPGLQIAFRKYTMKGGIWGSEWVGLYQFERFLTSPKFELILRNTLTISLYSLCTFPITIIFALFLNVMLHPKYKKVIQTTTYIPHFISTVVIVGLINQVFHERSGLYGAIVKTITGKTPMSLFANGKLFKHFYVWSGVWQGTGYGSILYIAALSNVDTELYDAAEIDGASRFQRMIYIDLPVLMPTVSLRFVMAVGGIMGVGYEKVLLMQNDLNLNHTEVISTYEYKIGLASGAPDYSLSTAIGLWNTVINFILMRIANYVSKVLGGSTLF